MVTYSKTAKNGLNISILLVMSTNAVQTGLMVISGPNIPARRLLFSTPQAAEPIADAMIKDWGGVRDEAQEESQEETVMATITRRIYGEGPNTSTTGRRVS